MFRWAHSRCTRDYLWVRWAILAIKLFAFYVTLAFSYFGLWINVKRRTIALILFLTIQNDFIRISSRLACPAGPNHRWKIEYISGLNFVFQVLYLFILHAISEFNLWMWHHTPARAKATLAPCAATKTHVHSNHFNHSRRNWSNLWNNRAQTHTIISLATIVKTAKWTLCSENFHWR